MRRIGFSLFSLGLLLLCVPVFAQVGVQATLTGTVIDTSGAVVPRAAVTIVEGTTHLTRTTMSNGVGVFEIGGLPVGTYSMTVTADGMKTWKEDGISLSIGVRRQISPKLQVGVAQETVVVEARNLISTENTSVSTNVDLKAMRDFPLNTTNPIAAVGLIPGMYYDGQSGPEAGVNIHGNGLRIATTTYTLDGINTNAPLDYGAITTPVIDDIAAMKVTTADGSAQTGHDPIQVQLVTKSGANEFHGTLWEYFQNDALNAQQRFAIRKPRLRYNQFGGNLGGPVAKDRTFFFGSFQAVVEPSQTVYNEFAPLAKRVQGDFSGYPAGSIKDPETGIPFPDNIIPPDRINPASKILSQFIPVANTIGGPYGSLFRAVANNSYKSYQSTFRLDQNINTKQRIYVRAVANQNRVQSPGYLPSVLYNNSLDQASFGVNYNYQISPAYLLTVTAGYTQSGNWFSSPQVGQTNWAEKAGIQGIPTVGATCCIGFPDLVIGGGYPGISMPFGVNGKLWGNTRSLAADLNIVKSKHSIGVGYSVTNPSAYGAHGSYAPRGQFVFFNNYSGDGMADFLLGYSSAAEKNMPLHTFGVDSHWQNAIHAEDSWKVTRDLTLNIGARYEYWAAPAFVAGNATTFDPSLGKVVVGEDSSGKIDYSHQPASSYAAAALPDLWVSQSDAKIDRLIQSNSIFEPRIGFAWQPHLLPGGAGNLVIRGGYGIYYNIFTANRAASDIGFPFFLLQFKALSTSQLVDWRQFFPADPGNFYQPSISGTTDLNIKPGKTQDWNFAIEQALPGQTTLTLTYLGTKSQGQPSLIDHDAPPPGAYPDLQAARPYPQFGSITLLQNAVTSWYHALQVQLIRNTYKGLYYSVGYTWGKSMSDHYGATNELSTVTPYAPAWYERGETGLSLRNILTGAVVYDLPVGRQRRYLGGMNWWEDAVIGGWELSGYYTYHSGDHLTMGSYGYMGNGYYSRADMVGNPYGSPSTPHPVYPGGKQWFNPDAFKAPAPYTWGNSPVGVITGPSLNFSNLSLFKNFYVNTEKTRYVQIGAEAYNFANVTNYNDPDTTAGDQYFGQILGTGGARSVQLRAKIIF